MLAMVCVESRGLFWLAGEERDDRGYHEEGDDACKCLEWCDHARGLAKFLIPINFAGSRRTRLHRRATAFVVHPTQHRDIPLDPIVLVTETGEGAKPEGEGVRLLQRLPP